MRETLTEAERGFLKLYRKAMKTRKELLAKAKEAELREFVIKKMIANCPVREHCRKVKSDVGNKV
jgi:hypothetical protein